jgi:hypothetical protein
MGSQSNFDPFDKNNPPTRSDVDMHKYKQYQVDLKQMEAPSQSTRKERNSMERILDDYMGADTNVLTNKGDLQLNFREGEGFSTLYDTKFQKSPLKTGVSPIGAAEEGAFISSVSPGGNQKPST